MSKLHYQAGYNSAKSGKFRAAPNNLKILSDQWREWYLGFDECTREGGNIKLDESFSLIKESSPLVVCF